MSYSRQVSKQIAIHYSKTVSYPASQSGGSITVSGTAYETVIVNVEVDTNPYDASVQRCSNHVLGLTGAVAATETAQVASIRDKAKKIGHTIVSGFFKTVRSEISQQVAELESSIEASLIHLTELQKRCLDKQRQMTADYHRISSRYGKIFEDLNQELENRIFEIDKPVFQFQRSASGVSSRTFDGAGAAMVEASEVAAARTKLEASRLKWGAWETLDTVEKYLGTSKDVADVMDRSSIVATEDIETVVPALFFEGTVDGGINRQTFTPEPVKEMNNDPKLQSALAAQRYPKVKPAEEGMLYRYFTEEMANKIDQTTPHGRRVAEKMKEMFSLENTNKN